MRIPQILTRKSAPEVLAAAGAAANGPENPSSQAPPPAGVDSRPEADQQRQQQSSAPGPQSKGPKVEDPLPQAYSALLGGPSLLVHSSLVDGQIGGQQHP